MRSAQNWLVVASGEGDVHRLGLLLSSSTCIWYIHSEYIRQVYSQLASCKRGWKRAKRLSWLWFIFDQSIVRGSGVLPMVVALTATTRRYLLYSCAALWMWKKKKWNFNSINHQVSDNNIGSYLSGASSIFHCCFCTFIPFFRKFLWHAYFARLFSNSLRYGCVLAVVVQY